MENVPYYTMHPSVGVTAVVHAPSTEKARTTFLDWLERNGYMKRADRQLLRKNMVAQRLDDPNVKSDIVLYYGYQDVTPSSPYMPSGEPDWVERQRLQGEGAERELGGEQQVPEPKELVPLNLSKKEEPRMPIQKVMLRGFS